MHWTRLRPEATGAVGSLVLSHPDHHNALDLRALEELIAAARWFDERPELRVVVVHGEGRFFCPGANLRDPPVTGLLPGSNLDWIERRELAQLGRRAMEAIERMRAVTIAAVHGAAVGGGLLLMLACDLRLVAEGTRLQLPELELGVPLAWGGLPRLVAEVGPARAKSLLLTGRAFTPAEARAMGLVNEVVAEAELLAEARSLAERLADKPSVPMIITKQHVNAVRDHAVGAAFGFMDGDVLMGIAKDPEMLEAALKAQAGKA